MSVSFKPQAGAPSTLLLHSFEVDTVNMVKENELGHNATQGNLTKTPA